MVNATDCIVVGGGIIGMLTARELALNGMRVRLFDRGLLGQECSWAGGGILSPLYPWQVPDVLTDLGTWSQQQFPLLCEQLLSETGIDAEWIQSGMLVFDPQQFKQANVWADRYGNKILPVTEKELVQMEPAIRQNTEDAFYIPDVAQIRNPRFITAVKQNLLNLEVLLHESTDVTGLIQSNGKIQGVSTTTDKYTAEYTIIACGAWSHQLFRELNVYPIRGQMLCFKSKPGLFRHILIQKGDYIIPRKDGYFLVGSTLEDAGFNNGITDQARQHLQQVLLSLLTNLDGVQYVDHWSGLRPCTMTGLPYIGPHRDFEGLYFNTGHFRNGLLLAPGSARLIADTILGKPSFMGVDRFSDSGAHQHQAVEL